jgi:hypothetical protein
MKTLLDNIRMKKLLLMTLIIMMTVIFGTSFKKPVDDRKNQSGYIPKSGFVPNKITAIKIAETIWLPIYGERIYRKKPYTVKLKNGVWIIEGTLPTNSKGGVPYIEIQKTDGKILKVMYGK